MGLTTVKSPVRTLAVLHPVFALTGVVHAVGGALLPSLAMRFHLGDSESGLLFLLYYAGTSLGALLCRWNFVRTIKLGFIAMACCCFGVFGAPRPLLTIAFLLLGISVGVPMTAVSLFTGRAFPDRCAPILTFLNFSWSAGALAAPLIAARVLVHHTYRSAYLLFGVMAVAAALACSLELREPPEPAQLSHERSRYFSLGIVLVFALGAFLQVGIENTAAAWLPTFALRTAAGGIAGAAAWSSFYWLGFLASRGFSSFVLMRVASAHVFRMAIITGIAAALLLASVTSAAGRGAAMFLLGAALAPIYPLVIAGAFARMPRTSDTRWVLATAGFGGSVLPWLAGAISAHAGSLRMGMLVIPAALLLMVFLLPAFGGAQKATPAQ